MKKLLGLLLVIITFISCEEVGPTISLQKTNRVVLIEEFTGVKCVNCPLGSAKIQELLANYEGQLIAVSIHSGIFSSPYNESKYDFRTDDGNELETYLGPPSGYPSSVINRQWFQGQQERVVYLNDWAGYIQNELQEEPVVRIDVDKDYNEATRQLDINTDLFFFKEIIGQTNITVLITEDGVEDYQLTPDGKDPNYSHKHILRDIITTSYTGDQLGNGIAASTAMQKTFSYTLPDEWKADKCHVIVFVNKNEGNDLDVLQAVETGVAN